MGPTNDVARAATLRNRRMKIRAYANVIDMHAIPGTKNVVMPEVTGNDFPVEVPLERMEDPTGFNYAMVCSIFFFFFFLFFLFSYWSSLFHRVRG